MPHQNHTGLWVSGFLKYFLNPSLFQEDSTSGEPGDSKLLLLAKPSRGQRWLHHPSQVKSSHRREGERVVFRVLDQQRGQARPTRQAPVDVFVGVYLLNPQLPSSRTFPVTWWGVGLPQARTVGPAWGRTNAIKQDPGPEFKHLTDLGLSFFICKIKG